MLVLSRKYQEKIRIGDGITITVLRAKGKAVRLGIEAPPDVPVIRAELVFEGACQDGEQHGVACNGWQKSDPPAADTKHFRRPHRELATAPAPASEVSLRRVPRERTAEIFPQLLPGGGPLRAMLDQRAATI